MNKTILPTMERIQLAAIAMVYANTIHSITQIFNEL